MTVVVSTAKCIYWPYSAYMGVGNVVPTMMAVKAYASRPKANRRAVTREDNPPGGLGNPVPMRFRRAHRRSATVGAPKSLSVAYGLLRADAGERPDLEFGVDLRVAAVGRRQCADDAEDERQRNRDDAGVGQRKPREVQAGQHRSLRA